MKKIILLALLTVISISAKLAAFAVPDNVQAVFNNNTCLNCHAGSSPQGGLSLADATISETQLVDVRANCSGSGAKRVLSGDPSSSVLQSMLTSSSPICGGQMPPSGDRVSQADVQVIADWITSIGSATQFGLFNVENTSVDVNENAGTINLNVIREQGTQGQVAVDFNVSSLASDTANSPLDYQAQSGTLVFAEGESSKTITVAIENDSLIESVETFSLVLSNPTGGSALGVNTNEVISIIDDESAPRAGTVNFTQDSLSANENMGTITIMIERTDGNFGDVTVDLNSENISATVGEDYQQVSQTLELLDGETTKSIDITILDDSVAETLENFKVTLSNPTNDLLIGNTSTVTIDIVDNDTTQMQAESSSGGGGSLNDLFLILLTILILSTTRNRFSLRVVPVRKEK